MSAGASDEAGEPFGFGRSRGSTNAGLRSGLRSGRWRREAGEAGARGGRGGEGARRREARRGGRGTAQSFEWVDTLGAPPSPALRDNQ
jgi:hypothetical protein